MFGLVAVMTLWGEEEGKEGRGKGEERGRRGREGRGKKEGGKEGRGK